MKPDRLLMGRKHLKFIQVSQTQVVQLELHPFLTASHAEIFPRNWFQNDHMMEVEQLLKPVLAMIHTSNLKMVKSKDIKKLSQDCLVGSTVRLGFTLKQKDVHQFLLLSSSAAAGRRSARIHDVKMMAYVCPRQNKNNVVVNTAFSQLLKEVCKSDQNEISNYFPKASTSQTIKTNISRTEVTSTTPISTIFTNATLDSAHCTTTLSHLPRGCIDSAQISSGAILTNISTSVTAITSSSLSVTDSNTDKIMSAETSSAESSMGENCASAKCRQASAGGINRSGTDGKKDILKNLMKRRAQKKQPFHGKMITKNKADATVQKSTAISRKSLLPSVRNSWSEKVIDVQFLNCSQTSGTGNTELPSSLEHIRFNGSENKPEQTSVSDKNCDLSPPKDSEVPLNLISEAKQRGKLCRNSALTSKNKSQKMESQSCSFLSDQVVSEYLPNVVGHKAHKQMLLQNSSFEMNKSADNMTSISNAEYKKDCGVRVSKNLFKSAKIHCQSNSSPPNSKQEKTGCERTENSNICRVSPKPRSFQLIDIDFGCLSTSPSPEFTCKQKHSGFPADKNSKNLQNCDLSPTKGKRKHLINKDSSPFSSQSSAASASPRLVSLSSPEHSVCKSLTPVKSSNYKSEHSSGRKDHSSSSCTNTGNLSFSKGSSDRRMESQPEFFHEDSYSLRLPSLAVCRKKRVFARKAVCSTEAKQKIACLQKDPSSHHGESLTPGKKSLYAQKRTALSKPNKYSTKCTVKKRSKIPPNASPLTSPTSTIQSSTPSPSSKQCDRMRGNKASLAAHNSLSKSCDIESPAKYSTSSKKSLSKTASALSKEDNHSQSPIPVSQSVINKCNPTDMESLQHTPSRTQPLVKTDLCFRSETAQYESASSQSKLGTASGKFSFSSTNDLDLFKEQIRSSAHVDQRMFLSGDDSQDIVLLEKNEELSQQISSETGSPVFTCKRKSHPSPEEKNLTGGSKRLKMSESTRMPLMNLTANSTEDTDENSTSQKQRSALMIPDDELRRRVLALKVKLEAVFMGTSHSDRHKRYMEGGAARRCLDLDTQLQYVQEGQEDVVMEVLLAMFSSSQLKNLDYLMRVILPEALSMIYRDVT